MSSSKRFLREYVPLYVRYSWKHMMVFYLQYDSFLSAQEIFPYFYVIMFHNGNNEPFSKIESRRYRYFSRNVGSRYKKSSEKEILQ